MELKFGLATPSNLWALGWQARQQTLAGIVNYPLTEWQWGLLVVWIIINAYSEGYRGFQKKFSPMVRPQ